MVSQDRIRSYFEKAMALHQEGLLNQALEIYLQLLVLRPESGVFLGLLGTIFSQAARPDSAALWLDRALCSEPLHLGNLLNRGQLALQIGQRERAYDCYGLAFLLNPGCGQTIWHLAFSFSLLNGRSGDSNPFLLRALCVSASPIQEAARMADLLIEKTSLRDAVDLLQWISCLDPTLSDPYFKLGFIHQEMGFFDLALSRYDRATHLSGPSSGIESMRAFCLRELRHFKEALASYDYAIRGGVVSPEIRINRGMTLLALHQFKEALDSHERAAIEKPALFEAYMNRGNVLQKLGRHQEALRDYDRAIHLNPLLPDVHLNRGCLKLMLGDFPEGWAEFESRFETEQMRGALRSPDPRPTLLMRPLPDLKGKRVLIYPEQGLGDYLQFCRFAPSLVDQGATVYLEAPEALFELMGTLDPRIFLTPPDGDPQLFDLKIPVMSLAQWFVPSPNQIPQRVPYLHPNDQKVAFWQHKLVGFKKPRIGLVWSGGLIKTAPDIMAVQELRNIPLSDFERFGEVDADFFSLQKGENGERQLAALREGTWAGPKIIDYSSEFNTFSDTAAFIQNLDLVIAVDTSTAHLAGAMQKPVWILNRYDTCWRWFLREETSPWYPSARLFRQDSSRSWAPVVARVLEELKRFVKTRTS